MTWAGQATLALEVAIHLFALTALTLYAYRHVFNPPSRHDASLGLGVPSDYPDWDILWDDRQNFVQNTHVTSGLSWENVKWSWSDEAVIHGVFEPISLIIKMGLHQLAMARGIRMEEDTRWYRVVNLTGHVINEWLVYLVGLAIVASACDYGYLDRRIQNDTLMEEKKSQNSTGKDMSDGEEVCPTNNPAKDVPGLRRRKQTNAGKKENHTNGAGSNESASTAAKSISPRLQSLQSSRRYLTSHRRCTAWGCLLGTAVFAVHPLQVQTIGWPSCMSYFFATAFALLSVWCWVCHRDRIREQARQKRLGVAALDNESTADAKNSKTPYVSFWQIISVVLYALASLCKAPAVVLPLVLIILDVYLYSAPLSVHSLGREAMEDALAGGVNGASGTPATVPVKRKRGKGKAKRGGGPSGVNDAPPIVPARSSMQPAKALKSISGLVRLVLCSLPAHLPHILALPPLLYLHVSGNEQASSKARGIAPLPEKCLRACWALGWYLVKLIYPSDLAGAVHYNTWDVSERWDVTLAVAIVPLLTVAVVAVSLWSSWGRITGCGWGCTIALLLPTLGIVQHARFVVADRYFYMPLAMSGSILGAMAGAWHTLSLPARNTGNCAGFVMFGGPIPESLLADMKGTPLDASVALSPVTNKHHVTAEDKSNRRPDDGRLETWTRIALLAFSGIVLCSVALSATYLTPLNLRNFRNKELLWSNTARIFPGSESAHTNLAFVYQQKGPSHNLDKAAYHARRAVEINPFIPKYWFNLVLAYHELKQPDEIVAFLKDRLKKLPRDNHWAKSLHAYMGRALKKMGEWDGAERELNIAASLGDKRATKELEVLRIQKSIEGKEHKARNEWAKEKAKRKGTHNWEEFV